ncbi:MAG: hypothetical protein MRY63_06395 [Neomegalonema sp.]|nr:hypothetical protein [Neomegalonema sp.]
MLILVSHQMNCVFKQTAHCCGLIARGDAGAQQAQSWLTRDRVPVRQGLVAKSLKLAQMGIAAPCGSIGAAIKYPDVKAVLGILAIAKIHWANAQIIDPHKTVWCGVWLMIKNRNGFGSGPSHRQRFAQPPDHGDLQSKRLTDRHLRRLFLL